MIEFSMFFFLGINVLNFLCNIFSLVIKNMECIAAIMIIQNRNRLYESCMWCIKVGWEKQ